MALTKEEIYERAKLRAKAGESQRRKTARTREQERRTTREHAARYNPGVVNSKLRIDRQAADQEFRKSQSVSAQQARVESENRRIARQDQQAKRRLYTSSVDSSLPSSSGDNSFSSTSTGKAVGSGSQSVSSGIFRVILVVVGLSLIYLFVSNGGQGGATITNGLGKILTAFTSNQSLFSSNSTPTPSGTYSESTASGGVVTNNPTQSIQQGAIAPGAPRPQVADPGRQVPI